jgi:endo-1,4-beta-xylanase
MNKEDTMSACDRREFLRIATAVGLTASAYFSTDVLNVLAATADQPLRDRAKAKGLLFGACAQPEEFNTPAFAQIFAQQCGIMVPEGALEFKALRSSLDEFNFQTADELLAFARAHNISFRGHSFVWHNLPSWFEAKVNAGNARRVMEEHIAKVGGHYAGHMHSWDVVNEAIALWDHRPDGLRNTPWLRFLGPDYIELAFRAAAKADPKALLVYNENRLEYDIPEHENQRHVVLKLLEKLRSKGAPVQALGIQSHLTTRNGLNPKKIREFLREVSGMGLKILVTELDVADKDFPSDVPSRDRMIADVYETYLSAVLDERAVIAVLTWGLSDRYSWLSKYAPRADGVPVRPLPLDANFKPKSAWQAIATAFDHAPAR